MGPYKLKSISAVRLFQSNGPYNPESSPTVPFKPLGYSLSLHFRQSSPQKQRFHFLVFFNLFSFKLCWLCMFRWCLFMCLILFKLILNACLKLISSSGLFSSMLFYFFIVSYRDSSCACQSNIFHFYMFCSCRNY